MSTLSERQKMVLALVIRDYIDSAIPVGSNRLVNTYGIKQRLRLVRERDLAKIII